MEKKRLKMKAGRKLNKVCTRAVSVGQAGEGGVKIGMECI